VRSLNYTGRRRLRQSDVTLIINSGDNGVTCKASVDLTHLAGRTELPPAARIVLEAANGNSVKFARLDLGTVAQPNYTETHLLPEFGGDEAIVFRVKVVHESGVLAALAKGLKPTSDQESQQRALLPVSIEPLDGLVYRVDFPDGEMPTLILNKALDISLDQGIKSFAISPLFVALVFPSVVREILTRFLCVDGHACDGDDSDLSESTEPVRKWLEFARLHNPEPPPESGSEPSECLAWIETVVASFGRAQNVVQRCEQALSGGRK